MDKKKIEEKKKVREGFTLIELLAVILILGIIALIAIPVVTNIIEEAKKGAAQRSADGFINAVENQVAVANISDNIDDIRDDAYKVSMLTSMYDISVKGKKPTDDSWVTLSNGEVSDYSFVIDGYIVTKDMDIIKGTTPKVNPLFKTCKLANGTALQIGSEYTCDPGDNITRTFYILEVTSDEVSLIMNRNIDDTTIAWSQDGSNHKDQDESYQAVTAKTKFPTNWSKVRVSMPTYNQLYNVNSAANVSSTPWLCDYLNGSPNSVNNIAGYWTASPDVDNAYYGAWNVRANGSFQSTDVDHAVSFGVRLVITIPKTDI